VQPSAAGPIINSAERLMDNKPSKSFEKQPDAARFGKGLFGGGGIGRDVRPC
jgi:hypothetical protein